MILLYQLTQSARLDGHLKESRVYVSHVDNAMEPTVSTCSKNNHFEMILDVGIGEKRKETRFLI